MRAVIAGKGDIAVDYLAVVDPETLVDLDKPAGRVMIAGAISISVQLSASWFTPQDRAALKLAAQGARGS